MECNLVLNQTCDYKIVWLRHTTLIIYSLQFFWNLQAVVVAKFEHEPSQFCNSNKRTNSLVRRVRIPWSSRHKGPVLFSHISSLNTKTAKNLSYFPYTFSLLSNPTFTDKFLCIDVIWLMLYIRQCIILTLLDLSDNDIFCISINFQITTIDFPAFEWQKFTASEVIVTDQWLYLFTFCFILYSSYEFEVNFCKVLIIICKPLKIYSLYSPSAQSA